MVRLTKIVATLGPASENRLDEMILAGVNVFRLNFSHTRGDYSNHIKNIKNIRETSERLGIPVAILGDLQGPKFRVGELENHQPITLIPGARIKFSVGSEIGNTGHIYTKNAPVIQGLSVGHKVLLNDGSLELKVVERLTEDDIICEVIVGGPLGEKKGINVPDIIVSSKLSDKDKADALFAVQQALDYIAISFVQTPQDVVDLRNFCLEHVHESGAPRVTLAKVNGNETFKPWADTLPLIISKIEKPQAVENVHAILDVSDGLMVARGDLGVEMSIERVPAVQKMLIELCNQAKKPVITATQMLESMITSPVPTRAEVSDVANAVFDGSDAVMLSAESAVGAYPVHTVATQAKIIQDAERTIMSNFTVSAAAFNEVADTFRSVTGSFVERVPFYQTVARAAVTAARKAGVRAIVSVSNSGLMASRIAKYKPYVPVIAVTTSEHAMKRMALIGGVHPLLVPPTKTAEDTLHEMEVAVREHGWITDGEMVVFCSASTTVPTLSNTMKLYNFGEFTRDS